MDKKHSILIVDDNENNLKVIGKMLYDRKFKISLAKSGYEALNYISKYNFDLILLDIMMPEMDGFEVCTKIKSNEQNSKTPIIFLSAKNNTEDIIKGFQIGAVDYITKPFNIEEVLARINTHIELGNAREEINQKNKELYLINQHLTEMNEELKEMNDAKDKFFSIIAHDLKAPFSSFLSITNKINVDFHTLSLSDIKELSSVIHESATHLYKLLEDLLVWSRSQIGQIPFKPAICNLSEFINSSVYLYNFLLIEKEININIDINSDIEIFADVNMINTVFRNLINNAIKFTNRGGEIKIFSEEEGENILIHFQDNGVGISEVMLENLFKLDFQRSTDGTEGEKGTGLGLLICKEFINKNGGEITVKSQIGKGTTFTISLPKIEN